MNSPAIERVAETHYMLRPVLKNALTNQELMPGGKKMFPDCDNYLDVWKQQLSDKFFDMGTLIRLAASVETILRDYYAQKKGYQNLTQLRQDPQYQQGIFQRIMPQSGRNGAIELFKTINVDLTTLPDFPTIQELMLHRHLYAHNLGIIDEQYIKKLKKLTGTDIMTDANVSSSYPKQDAYWFEPLKRIPDFIEASRRFFRQLP